MIKHIFCDLDGTLFREKISDKDKDAIDLARKNDISFNIATGRVVEHCTSIIQEIDCDGYLICENGSYIYDSKGELIFKRVLSDFQIKKIINVYKSLSYVDPNEEIIYFKYNGKIIMPVDGSKAEYLSRGFSIDENILNWENFDDLVGNIGILTENPEKLTRLVEDFKVNFPMELDIYKSSPTTMNIVPNMVSKFDAIKTICKREKINLNEISTIGDSANDIPMLKNIEVSFSMQESEDEVKSSAKYETPTVADAINMIIDLNNDVLDNI